MAKEYIWRVDIGGVMHEIRCVISNNRFILYDNDEYVTAVYRKLFSNIRGGVNETITIAGKDCRFVVWDSLPDLEVDGKMLRAGCSYVEGLQQFRNSRKILAIIYFCLAVFWVALSFINPMDLKELIMAALLALVGMLYLYAWRKLKRFEG